MRAVLLVVLGAAAGAALVVGSAGQRDCTYLAHEADLHTAALSLCAQNMSCRFTYQDVLALHRQMKRAEACEAAITGKPKEGGE